MGGSVNISAGCRYSQETKLRDSTIRNRHLGHTLSPWKHNGSEQMAKVPPEEDLEELLIGIRSHDKASMELFFAKMYPALYRYIARMVDPQDSEEVVNDVMFEIWKNADSFNGDSKISTWVFGIARNWCFKKYQSKSALKRSHVSTVEQSELEMHKDKHDQIASTDTIEEIEHFLDQLSDQHRSAILLIAEGRSYREIASLEDCPEATARTRVFNARKQLQALLHAARNPV